MISVFDCADYKSFLKARLGRGQRNQFASSIGCQPSFVSQVLNGKPNLSLEQGILANEFFGHSSKETRHFMLLLQLARSGTGKLKAYYSSLVQESKQEQQKVSARISKWRELSDQDKHTYYSSWSYPALHVLSSIPVQDQMNYFQKKIGLSVDQLSRVIEYLVGKKVLTRKQNRITPTEQRLHLPADSDLILGHHKNFRLRALEEFKAHKKENLHYSMLLAVSHKDAEKIRNILLEAITDIDVTIAPSKEEAAYQLSLDWFEL